MKVSTLFGKVMAMMFAIAMLFVSGVTSASDMVSSSLSPDGMMSAVWTKNHEIVVIDSGGSVLHKIGIRGAAPMFSHDGNLVAYEKLADSSQDDSEQSLFEFAQGIAVYDLRTGKERLVTDGGGDDFAPVGFSKDMSLLYFNSTRPYEGSSGNHVASLWVVELKSGKAERLTNTSEKQVQNGVVVPIVGENPLWSSDRTMIISSIGSESGVWKFALTSRGVSAVRIADGDSPKWVVSDESFVVRTISDGKTVWRTLRVR